VYTQKSKFSNVIAYSMINEVEEDVIAILSTQILHTVPNHDLMVCLKTKTSTLKCLKIDKYRLIQFH
jgi:hypothetical protein